MTTLPCGVRCRPTIRAMPRARRVHDAGGAARRGVSRPATAPYGEASSIVDRSRGIPSLTSSRLRVVHELPHFLRASTGHREACRPFQCSGARPELEDGEPSRQPLVLRVGPSITVPSPATRTGATLSSIPPANTYTPASFACRTMACDSRATSSHSSSATSIARPGNQIRYLAIPESSRTRTVTQVPDTPRPPVYCGSRHSDRVPGGDPAQIPSPVANASRSRSANLRCSHSSRRIVSRHSRTGKDSGSGQPGSRTGSVIAVSWSSVSSAR